MKKHLLTLALIGTFIGGFYYLDVHRHPVKRRVTARFMPNQAARNLGTAAFLPVTASNLWSELETSFLALARTNATNWQHAGELLPQIKRFIACYSQPSFDSYVDFKTAGIPYELSFDRRITNLILYWAASQGVVFPTNEPDRARAVWELGTASATNGVRPTITDISVERLTVSMQKLSTSRSPTFYFAKKDTGAPQYMPPTLVSFKETPEKIKKQQGSVWFAVVGLPCKTEADADYKKAHFLHVCFYWSDQYRRWLPLELLDDYAYKMPTHPPIVFPGSYTFPIFF